MKMSQIINNHELTIAYLVQTVHFALIWFFTFGYYYVYGYHPTRLFTIIIVIVTIPIVLWFAWIVRQMPPYSYIHLVNVAHNLALLMHQLTRYLDTMDVLHSVGIVTLTTLISLLATFQNYIEIERWEPLIYVVSFVVHGQLTWSCLLGSLGLWIYLGVGIRRGIERDWVQRTIVHWLGPFGYMLGFV